MAGVFQCKDGKVALWTGGTDDAPFTNPRGNIDRVSFHSDFDYPKIIQVRSVTLSMPAMPENAVREHTYNLFAHGRPGFPYILGVATIGGVKVPLAGHVPAQVLVSALWGGLPTDQWARWIALGSDGTNVVVHEYGRTPLTVAASAVSVPVTIYITDELL